MREIEFRGKTSSGRWLYGDFRHGWSDESPSGYITQDHKYVMVKKETVGQYTGLKDENGVEIYEGDVVSCNTFRGVVKYNSYTASFQAVSAGWWPISLEYDKHDPFEVIGNIFDDPELDKQFGEVYGKEQ